VADTPIFTYEAGDGFSSPGAVTLTDPIYVLYSCIQDAFGPQVTMDDTRQSSAKRRKSKAKVKKETNDGINLKAAKMTKCIVNYMASSGDSTIIDYDFELENVVLASDFNAAGYLGTAGTTGDEEGTTYLTMDRDLSAGTGYDGNLELDPDQTYDIDWEIYEEIRYVGAPISTITFEF
jgi:hypothetical protein